MWAIFGMLGRRWLWKVLMEMAAIEIVIAFADTYPEARRQALRRLEDGEA